MAPPGKVCEKDEGPLHCMPWLGFGWEDAGNICRILCPCFSGSAIIISQDCGYNSLASKSNSIPGIYLEDQEQGDPDGLRR